MSRHRRWTPGGPDPGELLSGSLDGALDDAEQAEVDRMLAEDPAARTDLASLREVRELVRGLPPVDPPEGALDAAIAAADRDPFSRVRIKVGVNLVATAAAWLALLGLAQLDGTSSSGSASVASLAALHPAPADVPTDTAADPVAVEESAPVGRDLGLPATLGEYELAQVMVEGDRRQALYVHDDQMLSVFVAQGEVTADDLPPGSRPLEGTDETWMVPAEAAPGGAVLVSSRDDVTLFVVGEQAEASADWLEDVNPEAGDDTVLDRIVDAGRGLLDAFTLGRSDA